MQKRKLLIAEESEELRTALADLFRGSCQVHCCADGSTAQRELLEFRPDVLVLDLMLPGYDGISLLQWSAEQGIRPMVLAITRFCSDYVAESAQRLGVGYLMLKPCSLSALAARVADMNQRIRTASEPPTDPGSRISSLLLTLGVPPKLRGFMYLKEAVVLYREDPLQSVTKVLYPGWQSAAAVPPCMWSAVSAAPSMPAGNVGTRRSGGYTSSRTGRAVSAGPATANLFPGWLTACKLRKFHRKLYKIIGKSW